MRSASLTRQAKSTHCRRGKYIKIKIYLQKIESEKEREREREREREKERERENPDKKNLSVINKWIEKKGV